MDDDIEINFPVEFFIRGTPVSLQASSGSRNAWKQAVRDEVNEAVAAHCYASEGAMSVMIYDFPTDPPSGDIDNIIKPILDSLETRIYMNDNQVSRVVAQRFLPEDLSLYSELPDVLGRAALNEPPYVFVRVSTDVVGETQ